MLWGYLGTMMKGYWGGLFWGGEPFIFDPSIFNSPIFHHYTL